MARRGRRYVEDCCTYLSDTFHSITTSSHTNISICIEKENHSTIFAIFSVSGNYYPVLQAGNYYPVLITDNIDITEVLEGLRLGKLSLVN
ncbi:unnamed protein product [Brugia pahangi]|uniref:Uncharacterized protein n=1 Tax=Brugia pahangi TaxID=6280 RepID=A0A0N4T8A7_BRUPA|nr:unnamed protein product [Brugia pahangi]